MDPTTVNSREWNNSRISDLKCIYLSASLCQTFHSTAVTTNLHLVHFSVLAEWGVNKYG